MALMITGTVEGVWTLAARNGLSVTEALAHGQELEYEADDVEDARTVEKYASEGICPALAITDAALARLIAGVTGEGKEAEPDMPEADDAGEQSTRAQIFAAAFEAVFA
ncbi:MAG: hypothetical protein NC301_08845 [Bacteroides sp.]|nr:hypothetical protein [Bacteroides sp.]